MSSINDSELEYYYNLNVPDGSRPPLSINDEKKIFFENPTSGVSDDEREVLSRLSYNETNDIIISTASIQTKPSSYLLGNVFRISNGVYAVSFKLGDGQDSIGLNTIYNEDGTTAPSYYHFGQRVELDVNLETGITLPDPFTLTYTTFGDNLTYDFMIKPKAAGILNAKYYLGNSEEGVLIFDEIRTIEESEVDTVIRFKVGNKYILPKNTQLFVKFEGVELEGGEVTDSNSPFFGQVIPYFKSEVQAYKKVSLVNHTEYVTESMDIEYPADFVVDTTNNEITLTIPEDFTDSFSIFDAKSKFNSNSCIIDFNNFDQGLAELSSRNDSFKFFYDSAEQAWFYVDLNSKRGGKV